MFALHLRAERFPLPTREHEFRPGRGWRFDFAWPTLKIAVEIEGGVGGKSRHTSPTGFDEDCAKYNQAAIDGWCVLRFSTRMVRRGIAIVTMATMLRFYPR